MSRRSTSSSSASTRSSSVFRPVRPFQKWKLVPVKRCRPMRTFSSTVRCGNTAEIWKLRITPRRAIWAEVSPVMSMPANTMRPRVGVRNLVSRLKQVVLPAPLGPSSAWMWPRCTRRLTESTAVKPLNSLVRSWVSRMNSLMGLRVGCATLGLQAQHRLTGIHGEGSAERKRSISPICSGVFSAGAWPQPGIRATAARGPRSRMAWAVSAVSSVESSPRRQSTGRSSWSQAFQSR
mmetsp:Transcript_36605/g.84932  ORF Transcript_36605/g.84932 Transcript_36605/m.84932 type:complete len:235 (+) Transcript_36605:428-1132(+)